MSLRYEGKPTALLPRHHLPSRGTGERVRVARHRARTGYVLGLTVLLVIYVGSLVSPWLDGQGWRPGLTYALAGLGWMTAVIAYRTADHLPTKARDRLRVLAAQTLLVYVGGVAIEAMWDAKLDDVPLIISLVVLVTLPMAGEALAIRVKHAEADAAEAGCYSQRGV